MKVTLANQLPGSMDWTVSYGKNKVEIDWINHFHLIAEEVKEFQESINSIEKDHRPAITQYNARLTISRNASLVLNSFEVIGKNMFRIMKWLCAISNIFFE